MPEDNCLPEGLLGFDTREFFEETACLAVDLAEGIGKSNVKLLWLLILSHNMLQSAMVNVLRGSANVGALDENSQEDQVRLLNEIRNGKDGAEQASKPLLAKFKTLLKRVQDGQCICPPLQLDQQQRKELDLLNKNRNEFMHFIDSIWTLHVDDLRQPILAALQVAGGILQHPECRRWTWDECFRDRVNSYLMKMTNHLDSLDECGPMRTAN